MVGERGGAWVWDGVWREREGELGGGEAERAC